MYTKRGIVYAEPYKILVREGLRAYQAPGEPTDFEEYPCTLKDMTVEGEYARWGRGYIVTHIGKNPTYQSVKTKLIKLRYSNDDQLAIMLNGDAEEMSRMQVWRQWASEVAKAICKSLGVTVE